MSYRYGDEQEYKKLIVKTNPSSLITLRLVWKLSCPRSDRVDGHGPGIPLQDG